MGQGVIRLARVLLGFAAWLIVSLATGAEDVRTFVPPGAQQYAPVLVQHQRLIWPEAPEPWTLGGLVEQESCLRLSHPACWNPRAELRTSREYGFGFGQITVTNRFNKFTELTRAHASLRDWRWEDRFDPGYQLIAMTEMTKDLWRRVPRAHSPTDHWGFVLSGYNGGLTAVLRDRLLCSNTPGCDPGRWLGHVETTSLKSRVPQPMYAGRSWFSINREHARNVLILRREKYRVFWRQ